MYELKKNGKVFKSKFVGIGPLSYEKRIYRAAVSQRLRNIALKHIYLRLNYLLTSNSVPLNKGLSPERLSATRTYHTAL